MRETNPQKKLIDKFYASRAWRMTRAWVIDRDKGICQSCGEIIFGEMTVHHEINLTPQNVNDPAISLNPELLKTLCHVCHDKAHKRFSGAVRCIERKVIVDDDLNINYKKRQELQKGSVV